MTITQPLTITVVTSYTLYGVGWERYYYNGTLAYSANSRNEHGTGEYLDGAMDTINHLISLGLDAKVEHISIELPYEYEDRNDEYSRWVTKTSQALDFNNLDDLLNAAEADKSLIITRH